MKCFARHFSKKAIWRQSVLLRSGCAKFCCQLLIRQVFVKYMQGKITEAVGWRISEKKSCYEKFSKIVRNFIKKSLHQRCFPLNLTKFLRAAYSESTHEQLLLTAEKNKPKCKTLGTIEIDGHKPRNILGYFKISKTCDFLFIDEIFLRLILGGKF